MGEAYYEGRMGYQLPLTLVQFALLAGIFVAAVLVSLAITPLVIRAFV